MNDDSISLLPVHSPTYPPESTSVTTSMPPNRPQKPSETPSAKGIARLTIHIPSTFRQKMPYNVGTSRWSTAEFKFYYLVTLFVIPVMVWIPMSLSLRNFSFLLYCKARREYSIQTHSFTSKLPSLLSKIVERLDLQPTCSKLSRLQLLTQLKV